MSSVNDTNATGHFAQPILPIGDPEAYQAVHLAIESHFSPAKLDAFLKSLAAAGLRIRHFEAVLGRGLLGKLTQAEYGRLGDADQGQIREFYLASLERVTPELRQKYFKLYAYY